MHVDLWIDDCSFDMIERVPSRAVNLAVRAYHYLKEELEADVLLVPTSKKGFVVSNAEAKRLLQDALPAEGAQIHDVMRDLGCDSTSGRLRRIRP